MSDLLDIARINGLQHPLSVREWGSDWWWPVYDIDVETGMMRLDVMGMLDPHHFGDMAEVRDGDGAVHDSACFYLESPVSES